MRHLCDVALADCAALWMASLSVQDLDLDRSTHRRRLVDAHRSDRQLLRRAAHSARRDHITLGPDERRSAVTVDAALGERDGFRGQSGLRGRRRGACREPASAEH